MEYASSYAVGGPQHGMGTGGFDAPSGSVVLPPPKPDRMHWTTLLMFAGMGICFVGLIVTIAGVPASMGYDIDGAPNRNKPNSSDPLKITQSLDGNMKWISKNSSDAEGSYVGYIKSVNRSEAAIAPIVQGILAMDQAVRSIDAALGEVGATTTTMGEDMAAMLEVSSASADTMDSLAGDIGMLATSMGALSEATERLTKRMAAIEAQAADIAKNGTSAARATTEELNATLPNEVPKPVYSNGQVAGAGAAAGDIHAGAQPPAPTAGDAQ